MSDRIQSQNPRKLYVVRSVDNSGNIEDQEKYSIHNVVALRPAVALAMVGAGPRGDADLSICSVKS